MRAGWVIAVIFASSLSLREDRRPRTLVGADTRFRTLLDKDRSVGALENDDGQARALEDRQARTLGEIAAFLAPDDTQLRRTQANILTQLVFTTVGWASMYLVWEALRCNIFTNIQRLNYQSSNFPNIHNTSFFLKLALLLTVEVG